MASYGQPVPPPCWGDGQGRQSGWCANSLAHSSFHLTGFPLPLRILVSNPVVRPQPLSLHWGGGQSPPWCGVLTAAIPQGVPPLAWVTFFQEQPSPQHGVSDPSQLPLLLKRVTADGHGLPVLAGTGWNRLAPAQGRRWLPPSQGSPQPCSSNTVRCHAATSCCASHSLKALESNY